MTTRRPSDFDRWLTTEPEPVDDVDEVEAPATLTEADPAFDPYSGVDDPRFPFDDTYCDACRVPVGPGLAGTDPEGPVWTTCFVAEDATGHRILCEDCTVIDPDPRYAHFTDHNGRPGRVTATSPPGQLVDRWVEHTDDVDAPLGIVGTRTPEPEFLLHILDTWHTTDDHPLPPSTA